MIPTYDIVPGKRVGRFQLGDSLWHILELLRSYKVEYPKVEISWDPENVTKSAVTIHLPHVDLYFPPSQHQTLTLILLSSLPALELSYDSHTLSSANEPLTRARVGKLLGPTHATGHERSEYPGIEFDFGPGPVGGSRDDVVQKMRVRPREDEGEVMSLSPLESCEIKPGQGVTLYIPEALEVVLGQTTAVDLVTELGSPPSKFWKEDDRLAKMWGVADTVKLEDGYRFWNYFQYGLDFLLDPDSVVIKVICHSNIVGTPLFGRYARCPWVLPTSSGDLAYDSPSSSFRSNLSARAHASYVDEVKLLVPDTPARPISPNSTSSKGSDTGKHTQSSKGNKSQKSTSKKTPKSGTGRADLSDWKGKEDVMVLDRLSEVGYEGITGVSPSRLFGFDGVIIEEDQASGGICSILVWKDDTLPESTAAA